MRSGGLPEMNEFGVIANVIEDDKVLRFGARVVIVGEWTGGGCERVRVDGMSKAGRSIRKYVPIRRLGTFRASWLHENERVRVIPLGDRPTMEAHAAFLEQQARTFRNPKRRPPSEGVPAVLGYMTGCVALGGEPTP